MNSVLHFDNIVSLGGSCKVAYEARAYFDFGQAYPFDWWICKAKSLACYLENLDPEGLYAEGNLELIQNNEISQIASKLYDFRFHHEFGRHWELPNHPVRQDWRDGIENVKIRHLSLMSRFLSLNVAGNNILFVRTCEMPGDADGAIDLLGAIDKLFNKADWRMLIINGNGTYEDRHAISRQIQLKNLEWNGLASREWSGLFLELGLAVTQSSKRFDRKVRAESD
ncbi:DUF1796 family putative cysteine peptidase [Methylobacterium dankookense]|uniref:DUF1796 family putative cysteine peptidase n=1 Tax=Methylobacterium dankookense TaxID=560405 RepID=UPI0011A350BC|nr:DUF1796 family putative cysteine peptidase [Methylobacterium dankookense]